MNTIDLTPLFQAVIALVAVIITSFVIPYIRKRVSAEDLEEFHGWVEIAVAAAEQLYSATAGEEKKLYVVNYLLSKGYTVNAADLENAIEAAVLKLHAELYGGAENEGE